MNPETTPQSSLPYDLSPRLVRHARIPKIYWNATLAPNDDLAGFAHNIASNMHDGRGLLLMGPHGVGKTYGSCAICLKALVVTPKVLYMTAPDLVDAFKPGAAPFDEEMTWDVALRSRNLLVIDDLGHEYKKAGSEFAVQMLINLFRYRVTNARATILTTNLDPNAIKDIYSEGFYSLLAEHCVAFKLKGSDRRRDAEAMRERRRVSGLR